MNELNLEEFLEKLKEIVNIDSGSYIKNGPAKVADYLVNLYEKLGLKIIKRNNDSPYGPFLEIRNHDENEKIDILFSGHMDTVFPEGTVREKPYKREENLAYGPGIADMKAGLILIYYITKFITEQNLPINFCVAINSDEEIGSNSSKQHIRKLAKNATCAFIFEPGRKNAAFVSERKGGTMYSVKFHGIPSHAGVAPEKGASAIHEMANFILEVVKLNDYENGTSLNVGLVSGGTAVNVVSEYAECCIDIRFDKIEEYEKISKKIDNLANNPKDNSVKIEINSDEVRPPLKLIPDTKKILELIEEKGRELNIDVQFVKTGGGSDGNFIADEGCITIDGAGPAGDGFHSNSEVLFINSIEERFSLLLKVIKTLAINKKIFFEN